MTLDRAVAASKSPYSMLYDRGEWKVTCDDIVICRTIDKDEAFYVYKECVDAWFEMISDDPA